MEHSTERANMPNNDEVICPKCVHQFRAIPVNVQRLLLDAGYEPPFLGAAPLAQPEPPTDQMRDALRKVAALDVVRDVWRARK